MTSMLTLSQVEENIGAAANNYSGKGGGTPPFRSCIWSEGYFFELTKRFNQGKGDRSVIQDSFSSFVRKRKKIG